MAEIEILKGSGNREVIYAHENFVEPMLDYIVRDFEAARLLHDDSGMGAMVICDSSAQAKKMAEIFALKYAPVPNPADAPIPFVMEEALDLAAEGQSAYRVKPKGSGRCLLIPSRVKPKGSGRCLLIPSRRAQVGRGQAFSLGKARARGVVLGAARLFCVIWWFSWQMPWVRASHNPGVVPTKDRK